MTINRLFLDANILFSIGYGSPALDRLRDLAREKRCLLFASRYVIEEAQRNLLNPEHLKKLEMFLSTAHIVPEVDPEIPCPIDLPAKDRPVLLASISCKAHYLLTGDITHFGQYFGKTINGVRICRPRDYFLEKKMRRGKNKKGAKR